MSVFVYNNNQRQDAVLMYFSTPPLTVYIKKLDMLDKILPFLTREYKYLLLCSVSCIVASALYSVLLQRYYDFTNSWLLKLFSFHFTGSRELMLIATSSPLLDYDILLYRVLNLFHRPRKTRAQLHCDIVLSWKKGCTIQSTFNSWFLQIGDFGILVRSGFTVSKALFFNFLSALSALAGTALVRTLPNTIALAYFQKTEHNHTNPSLSSTAGIDVGKRSRAVISDRGNTLTAKQLHFTQSML